MEWLQTIIKVAVIVFVIYYIIDGIKKKYGKKDVKTQVEGDRNGIK